jgi:hypothetical protein
VWKAKKTDPVERKAARSVKSKVDCLHPQGRSISFQPIEKK